MQRVFKIIKENVTLCILTKADVYYFTVGHAGAMQETFGPFESKYDCMVVGFKTLEAKVKSFQDKRVEKQQKAFHYGNNFFRRKGKVFP